MPESSDWHLLFDEIVVDVAREMQVASEKIVADLKDRVSVPVGYAIGPRGGTTIIRSKPGEPPRKETGKLQASIVAETITVGDQVATSVSVGNDNVKYPVRLQQEMNRPITENELDAVEDMILDRVVDAVENP